MAGSSSSIKPAGTCYIPGRTGCSQRRQERVAPAEEEVDVGVVRGEVRPDSADLSGIRFLAGGWSAVVDTQHLNGASDVRTT